ncbi:MAG: lysyl oxidase family protein [Flavobacteriales bacterium]
MAFLKTKFSREFIGVLLSAAALFCANPSAGQCESGETEIEIVIVPDNWPNEISWELTYQGNVLGSGAAEGTIICFDSSIEEPCLQFSINDSYGDGIYAPGGYWLYQDGIEIASGNDYDYGETVNFDCAPGATCNDAMELTETDYGVIAQEQSNMWYAFTPPSNGMYSFSTCGATCDTRLWIYDYCNMGNFDNTNEGTIYYDDEEGGCGEQANLTVLLEGGITYWVRMGLGSPDYMTLVDLESAWAYHDGGEDLGSAWSATGFDDADWAVGNAELGYGDGDEATVVSYGENSSDKHITTYFRHSFDYAGNPGSSMPGVLRLRRDDGAVVYLNGVEVYRSNMPAGPINSETMAMATVEGNNESTVNEYPILLNLQTGENVLAVEIHQANATSSDISFDAALLLEDPNGACSNGFDWEFDFVGPPTGCTDEEACNYNPLAEVDSGDCVFPGDPECTGPDLIVSAQAIINSLSAQVMQVSETDCYIEEGCLNGYGDRELVRFTTHIQNIGELDYYIGVPSQEGNNQFEWGDCHNHWHHQGYAKYDLFTLGGQLIPIGFKNGFCVMDLECSGGGTGQYGCGNMGISAGCGDIYGSGLSCQWIDVTEVNDGTYYLVVRANYDFIPDALGRAEISYENNHAAVCINLDRSSGELVVETVEGCEPFDDCMGVSFGTAVTDCNGDCNGTALMGDLDNNGEQDFADAVAYVEHILGDDIEALPCTDIDQDDEITVSDAAYMALCQHFNVLHQHPDSLGYHDKCNFPVNHIVNPFDTVHFTIGAVNWGQQYLDVYVHNPNNRIVGYQFSMSGISISSAVSIADPIEYPITPSFAPGGNEVIGLSYENMSFPKHYEYVPFVRLYWTEIEEEVCIDFITDVVNEDYHNTFNVIEEGCVISSGISDALDAEAPMLYPNPMIEQSTLRFANPSRQPMLLQITDATGRIVYEARPNGTSHVIQRGALKSGAYVYTLSGGTNPTFTGRLNVQ